jgi:hypothetical protein
LPLSAAGLALLVTPGIVADIYALVVLDSLMAHIAVIFSQLFEERFLEIPRLPCACHVFPCKQGYRMALLIARNISFKAVNSR